MKKLFLLLLCCGMLASCSSPATPSSGDTSVTPPETTSETTSQEEQDEQVISGSFFVEDDVYTSLEPVSMYRLNDYLDTGTFKFEIKRVDAFSENGILFHANDNKNPTSYYFVGIDILGKFTVNRVENSSSINLYKDKLDYDYAEGFVEFSIYIDTADGIMDLYVKDEYLASIRDEEVLRGEYMFLKANGQDTSYQGIHIYNDTNDYINNFERYRATCGVYIEYNDSFVSQTANSLLVNEEVPFDSGIFEVTMTLGGRDSDNGVVFALTGTDGLYWEGRGIQYYFFFISQSGNAYLGKANNGGWIACAEKAIANYSNLGTYRIKITKDEGSICCYVNDVMYIFYNDPIPFQGTKFGLRAGSTNVAYKDIKLTHLTGDDADIEKFKLGSGDITASLGMIQTISSKTIGVVKDSNMYNGTLQTTFIPGSTSDAGIIFRASTPAGHFFENEEGLSYYYVYFENDTVSFSRYENGNAKHETRRFFWYGSYTNYDVKIIMDDEDIYCYFNQRLIMHYTDENPLTGGEYGFKSRSSNMIVTDFKEGPVEEKQTNQYLIFGHSYTDFWKTYKDDFADFEDIYNIGIGGSRTEHWGPRGYMKEVIAYEPEYGIYWNGINDINSNIANATIANNVREMAVGIHNELPNFKLILISVCRCPVDATRRDDIATVNNYLKQIAQDLDYVIYVDTELLYCTSGGAEIASYFTDGLHPTHQAYIMCVNKIMETIGG